MVKSELALDQIKKSEQVLIYLTSLISMLTLPTRLMVAR